MENFKAAQTATFTLKSAAVPVKLCSASGAVQHCFLLHSVSFPTRQAVVFALSLDDTDTLLTARQRE